jgi:hypothetical protein
MKSLEGEAKGAEEEQELKSHVNSAENTGFSGTFAV